LRESSLALVGVVPDVFERLREDNSPSRHSAARALFQLGDAGEA